MQRRGLSAFASSFKLDAKRARRLAPQARLEQLLSQYTHYNDERLKVSPSSNETFLHKLAEQSLQELKAFFDYADRPVLSAMAKIIDNNGKLPIDRVVNGVSELDEKDSIAWRLLELMKEDDDIPDISKPIDIDVLLSFYKDVSPNLRDNLKRVAQLANEVREAIPVSPSHPSMNRKLSTMLHANRILADRRKCIAQQQGYGNIASAKFTRYEAEKCGVGNCEELSSSLWDRLTERYGPSYADILYVTPGDHALVSFDLNKRSNALPWEFSWNAVMCDPWIGDAWPCFISANYLTTFRRVITPNSFVNVVTSFNDNCHSLSSFKDFCENKKVPRFFKCHEITIVNPEQTQAVSGILKL